MKPLILALLVSLSWAFMHAADAGNFSFCKVCPGYKLVMKGGDLLIYCPGATKPWLTYKNCQKPKATKDAAGNLNITCG